MVRPETVRAEAETERPDPVMSLIESEPRMNREVATYPELVMSVEETVVRVEAPRTPRAPCSCVAPLTAKVEEALTAPEKEAVPM